VLINLKAKVHLICNHAIAGRVDLTICPYIPPHKSKLYAMHHLFTESVFLENIFLAFLGLVQLGKISRRNSSGKYFPHTCHFIRKQLIFSNNIPHRILLFFPKSICFAASKQGLNPKCFSTKFHTRQPA